MGDPLTIGNELAANDLGILHARLLIRLCVRLGGERGQPETKPEYGQRKYSVNFHV